MHVKTWLWAVGRGHPSCFFFLSISEALRHDWVSRVGLHLLLPCFSSPFTPPPQFSVFYQFILVSRPGTLGWQSPKALLALEEVFRTIKSLRDVRLG